MKVTWDSQYGSVRMPAICAVTGQPATTTTAVTFRKQWAMFLPSFARFATNLANRPQTVQVPVCEPVRKAIASNRLLMGLSSLVLIVLIVAGAALRGPVGGVLAVIGVVAGVIGIIVFGAKVNVLKTDVDGTRLTIGAAAPGFAQQFAAMNPPGLVQLEATPGAPQPGYATAIPPQQYAQPQQYPQPQQYAQPQQYPQPQQYGLPQQYGQQAPQSQNQGGFPPPPAWPNRAD